MFNLVASNVEAKKFLNWKPKFLGKKGLEKGIIKTIEFLHENKIDKTKNKKFIY